MLEHFLDCGVWNFWQLREGNVVTLCCLGACPIPVAKEEQEEEDGEEEADGRSSEAVLLQDLRNNTEATFRQPARKLWVKNCVICFDPATVFGKREQFLPALVITVAWSHFVACLLSLM